MQYIDSHLHILDANRFSYSWCTDTPSLNRAFLLSDYLLAAKGLEIEKAIFVEGDVDEPDVPAEAKYAQDLAHTHPLIAGIVASARPERHDFPAHLAALLELPKLRGVRRVLHTAADDTSQSALFARNVRRLAAQHLTFDICVEARQLPLALALVNKCPNVQFILDHCGVPDIAGSALDPWRSHVSALAACPNVACKLSGIPSYAQVNWTVTDLRPWVEHVIDRFGWQRVMWGSDWPVCTLQSSLTQWCEAANRLVKEASPGEQRGLFYGNAARIYRL